MVHLNFPLLQKMLGVVLVVVTQQTSLLAQTPTPRQTDALLAPPPPPDNGAPTQREGAASRGPCIGQNKNLTALVPLVENLVTRSQNPTTGIVLSQTAASRPSFWFYVPYTLTSSHPLEFVLQDDAGKDLYSANLQASEKNPGVVGFQLPEEAPALEQGKRYRWIFSVYCNQEAPVIVTGLIERVIVKESLTTELEQASPSEKVALYRKAGLWQEALTTLAQLRRQNPDEVKLKAEWTQMLQSIGLKAIASEPLTAMLTQTTRIPEASNF